MSKSKNILVTGGAGFIGANLCRRLLADGHRVTCVDDLSTGRRENVAELMDREAFAFGEGHVADYEQLNALDGIYHLACPASPVHYQARPLNTICTAIEGTSNVLDIADAEGCKVVIASTSEVYGDPEVHPQPESYRGSVNTYGPRACYDEGKRAAESLCWIYRHHYGVDVRVARIFNTYGPWMQPDDGRAIPTFIRQAIAGEPLTVFGDGLQTRSCCYVDDLVGGLIRLMNTPDNPEGPVNLGNPEEVTVLSLAEIVREIVGGDSAIEHRRLPEDDPRRRRPDIARAQALLGWEPCVGLRDGLSQTVAWWRREKAVVGAGV